MSASSAAGDRPAAIPFRLRAPPIARPLLVVLAATAAMTWVATGAHAADAAAGRQKARACQACHGIDGIAKIPIAPHIAGESEIYLQNQLNAFRSGTRKHEIMTVVASGLSDEDIADLAAWYASIKISVEVPQK